MAEKTIIEAGFLTQHYSAQRAELWALIHALQLSKGKRVNIFTDSRYAFATLHVHGALYKERGLLTASGKYTKNKEEILSHLEPEKFPRNQKGLQSYTENIKKRIPTRLRETDWQIRPLNKQPRAWG